MNKSAVLFTRDLGFGYDVRYWLFRNVNLALNAGEILAVLGPNGCGKSTLLDLLLKLHKPLHGSVHHNKDCCFVPQFFTPGFDYSVLDIVLMGRAKHIGNFATPKQKDFQKANQSLRDLGLQSLAYQRFSRLSGGQKQMVLIARALATGAEIMLLDEPTSALDLHNQDKVLSLLFSLAKERGIAIIFTTHQPDHSNLIARKTLLLKRDNALFGDTSDILTSAHLSDLFQLRILEQKCRVQEHSFQHFVPFYSIYKENSRI